jgi:NTE family protein
MLRMIANGGVLISDGGGQAPDDADPPADWPRQILRVLKVIDNQVRELRKRQAIGSYRAGLRARAYRGIRSAVADYRLADPLTFDGGRARS